MLDKQSRGIIQGIKSLDTRYQVKVPICGDNIGQIVIEHYSSMKCVARLHALHSMLLEKSHRALDVGQCNRVYEAD